MVQQLCALTGRPQFPAGLRVLLCECCQTSRDAVQAQLQAQNYVVTCCSSISEAVAAITQAEASFDVLLTSASALAATKEGQKLREHVKDLPTVVMMDNPNPEEVMGCIKMGACEVLSKPLCPLRLKTIWQHQARRLLPRTASAPMLRRRSSGALADHSTSHHGASSPSAALAAVRASLEFNSASSGTIDAALKPQSPTATADFVASLPDTPKRAARGSLEDGRRGQKRKSKELQRCFTSPVPLADVTVRSTVTPLDVPAIAAPLPTPALGAAPLTAPAAFPAPAATPSALTGWPAPPTPALAATGGLQAGMVWGVPMNPMAVAPGITPPIFPAPTTPVAGLPTTQWPAMPTGMPAMGMPPMPHMPTPGMFGTGLMPGMPFMPPTMNPFTSPPMCMPPPLPMAMLAGATAGMPGAAPAMCGGVVEGMGVPACSPATTDPSAATFSGKSAQDLFNFGCVEDAGHLAPTASRAKMPRCESNNLLPFLEDLMGDNTADDMELELEALSLGCLGSAPTIPTSAAHHTMRRIDSLEDIISQSVVAF